MQSFVLFWQVHELPSNHRASVFRAGQRDACAHALGWGARFEYHPGMPIFHECSRCTACCRWPGQVRLGEEEIARLAVFLQLTGHEFIQQYTRLTHDRRGLALQEKSDGACIFLDGDNCTVQPVKPQQCSDFPNLWRHPDAETLCRAIPRLVGDEDYVRLVAGVTRRTEESVREILKLRDTQRPR